MKLNDAKDICLGNKPIKAVYLGDRLIWGRGSKEYMPVMSGITNYYDCHYDMTEESWQNLLDNRTPVTWQGSTLQPDGSVLVTGANNSYGRFVTPGVQDPNQRTVYLIAKCDEPSASWETDSIFFTGMTIGGGTGRGFTLAATNKAQGELYKIWSDQWGGGLTTDVSALDYHVIALVRNGSANKIYVDGISKGDFENDVLYTNSPESPHEWGVGCITRNNTYYDFGGKTNKYIKFIAVGSTAHTEEQVKENSEWLMERFLIENQEQEEPLPDGYTRLLAIESTKTGRTTPLQLMELQNTSKIVVDYEMTVEPTSMSYTVFCSSGDPWMWRAIGVFTLSGKSVSRLAVNNHTTDGEPIKPGVRYLVTAEGNYCEFVPVDQNKNTVRIESQYSLNITKTSGIYINSYYNQVSDWAGGVRYYSLKHYVDGELENDFVPVMYKNPASSAAEQIGMYDRVKNHFSPCGNGTWTPIYP